MRRRVPVGRGPVCDGRGDVLSGEDQGGEPARGSGGQAPEGGPRGELLERGESPASPASEALRGEGRPQFFYGVPQPKGSPSILRNRSTGRPFVLENEASRSWAETIQREARSVWGSQLSSREFKVGLLFLFERPKTSRRLRPTVKPDLDKLVRNVLDALTGILWVDDAQVTQLKAEKAYGPMPGVVIEAWEREVELIPRPVRPRGSRRRHDLKPGLSH